MKQIRKMGPLQNVLGMMPGMGKAMKQMLGATSTSASSTASRR